MRFFASALHFFGGSNQPRAGREARLLRREGH